MKQNTTEETLIDRLRGQLSAAIHFVSSKEFDKKEALALIDEARAYSAGTADSQASWAPARIWLQREQGDHGSHTWCEDSVGDGDIIEEAEYVRVDRSASFGEPK